MTTQRSEQLVGASAVDDRAIDKALAELEQTTRMLRTMLVHGPAEMDGPSHDVLVSALQAAQIGVGELSVQVAALALPRVVEKVAAGGRVRLVDDSGRPVAAVVPVEVLDELLSAEETADLQAVAAADAEGGDLISFRPTGS